MPAHADTNPTQKLEAGSYLSVSDRTSSIACADGSLLMSRNESSMLKSRQEAVLTGFKKNFPLQRKACFHFYAFMYAFLSILRPSRGFEWKRHYGNKTRARGEDVKRVSLW